MALRHWLLAKVCNAPRVAVALCVGNGKADLVLDRIRLAIDVRTLGFASRKAAAHHHIAKLARLDLRRNIWAWVSGGKLHVCIGQMVSHLGNVVRSLREVAVVRVEP